MTVQALSPPDAGRVPASDLVARSVAALSTAAPFAVPGETPGHRAVHLTSGSPAAEALPLTDLAAAFATALTRHPQVAPALQYSDSAGLPRLRALLAAREGVTPDRVLVTNGALHGVSLVVSTLLDPGDVVVIDDPVFPDTPRIIEAAGGRVLPVPVDRDGLDVDALEGLLRGGTRVKAVYTVPDFHNPSGHTLSSDRRRRLIELAEHHGFVVISDNPYRAHRLAGEDLPDLPDDGDHVVRISTFTKSLGPGLRLGWLVAPAWLAPHLVNVRRRIDFHSGTLTQHAVADLLERPDWFDDLASRARAIYAGRSRALVASLREHTGDLLAFSDPDGGFFVWARVTDERITASDLVSAAAGASLFFAPGSAFAPGPDSAAHRFVRLAYSAADVSDLDDAGPRLAAVAAGLRARPGSAPA